MLNIDPLSRTPIYEQITHQIESFILSGVLGSSARVPSVREISVQHSVNPRTVLKAYADLDERGMIRPVPGKGYFVCDDAREKLLLRDRALMDDFSALAQRLVNAGVSQSELTARIEAIYGKGESK